MGEVFAGRFELIDPVAAGGMGEVWTARDLRDQTVVAVKLLKQADAGGLLRFMREQGLRIHHDNILTPLAWAGIDDRVLFSMPLARGGSVSGLVKSAGALPPRFAAELLRQTLAALRAVHAADVVHRDVKPANLLLDATGTARPHLLLSDFGVALPLDEPRLTSKAWVIGTPGYLAPEQAAGGDPAPDQDLYAVGMVGKEMLTGKRPRRDGSPQEPPPPGTPPQLWEMLDRLTSDNPTARPNLEQCLGVLADPALAWQDQVAVAVPMLIRPDGHLGGPDEPSPWGAATQAAPPQPVAAQPSPYGSPFAPPPPAQPGSASSAPPPTGPAAGYAPAFVAAQPRDERTTARPGRPDHQPSPALRFGPTAPAGQRAAVPARAGTRSRLGRLAPFGLLALGGVCVVVAVVLAVLG